MYLTRIELKNTGPIENARIDCQFNENGTPKPIVLVGRNGSGKSIVIAHVVSALIEAHSTVFEDSDVVAGKVYKIRSPTYIRSGAAFSTAEIQFSKDFSVHEAQLMKPKNAFAEPFPEYSKWDQIEPASNSHYTSNFQNRRDEIRDLLNSTTHVFFPPNRFEEPAWLNEISLLNKASYGSLKNFSTHSNRPIVNYAPMRDLQNWLLDLLYDRHALERKHILAPVGDNGAMQLLAVGEGPATMVLAAIEEFLKELFGRTGDVKWSVGARNNRQIGLSIGNEMVTSNLFQLSTGQAVLLDVFLSIIRDADLSRSRPANLFEMEGMVLVDEIDLHLHTDLLHDLLPKLISLFPKIQFILTTHSPLFLIGMRKTFTSEGFQLLELPECSKIEVEQFSEFEAAYKHMRESARFQKEVKDRIAVSERPTLFLEGATDIDYLGKAAVLLGKEELLGQFELVDAVGSPHLNKIWDTYKNHLSATIKHKWLLLYDCDVAVLPENRGNLFRRSIAREAHKLVSGIENLFSDDTIQRAIDHKPAFVDLVTEHMLLVRGVEVVVPASWKVNRDEKRNLCDWLCANGTEDDFQGFLPLFDILEEVLTFEVD